MRLAFRLALRFLASSKGQTILIALGIAVGISVQIFIGSLIEGLQISLLDATIGRSSHITVVADEKKDPVERYPLIEQLIKERYPEVIAISPNVSGGAFLTYDDETDPITVRGFNLSQADDIYKFSSALVEGTLNLGADEVVIGSELAAEKEIQMGEWIDILPPNGKIQAFRVVGLIDLKVSQINKTWVVGNLDMAKQLLDYDDNQVSSIEIQIKEPFSADLLSQEMAVLSKKFPVRFEDWKTQNQQLLSGLAGQSSSSLIIQVFVVISVVLGIASVLAISVLQKSKQIGILKAMGISDTLSSLVFLFQGFMLGLLGGILGIGLGLGILWSFSQFAIKPDGSPVVPIFINYTFIGISGLIAVSASTMAAVIPALKSRSLSPIEVIKNG